MGNYPDSYSAFAGNFNNVFTNNFGKVWAQGQGQKDKEQELAMTQAIESMQKSADAGGFESYEPFTAEDGRTGLKLTPQGEQATNIGGFATLDSLQNISDQAKTQKSVELTGKKIDAMVKVNDNADKIIENAFKEKDKYETATGNKYPIDMFKTKLDSAKSLYAAIGRDIDPMQYETLADFRQAKKVEDEKVLVQTYQDFLTKPTPEGAVTLDKFIRKAKLAYGGPDNQYKVIEDAVTKYQAETIKQPDRPYKVGQVLPGRDEGDKHITYQVTGYDANNQPVLRKVAEAPRYRPPGSESDKPKRVPYRDTVTGSIYYYDVNNPKDRATLMKSGRRLQAVAENPMSPVMREGLNPQGEPSAAKPLDAKKATEYLRKAGGDKDKARKAAKKDGYTF